MRIFVNYEDLRSRGSALRSHAASYRSVIERIYAKTAELTAAWQGTDAQAYITSLESYRPALLEIEEVTSNYGTYAMLSADAYQNLQNERAASARGL